MILVFLLFAFGFPMKPRKPITQTQKINETNGQEKKSRIICGGCQILIELIKNKIANKSVDEIMKFVTEKCPDIRFLNKICEQFDRESIEELVYRLSTGVNSNECCEYINLC